MIFEEDNYLLHYGTPRHSGRYPWGSGGQHATSKSFLDAVERHRKVDKMSDPEIAKAYKMTTTQLRAMKSIAKNEQRQDDIGKAQRMRAKGMSNIAIGQAMGRNESSVRALLAPSNKERVDILSATTDMLKDEVAKKQYVDVGIGNERHLDISKEKLGTAVAALQAEGYGIHYVKVPQLGTGKQTTIKVLAAPGVTYSTVFRNRDKIATIAQRSEDGGRSFQAFQPPVSIPARRVDVRYADEGGAQADGVIYVRRGVSDISLGKSSYAQVRVMVNGTHYLKGMAVYKDDLPDGVDLVFNTNKHNTGNKLDAMKKISDDPDNPFGAITDQIKDANGKVSSSMNIVNEEGDWSKWSANLSSQFLSKQSPRLAREQLAMLHEKKKREFDEIMALTNPAVRRKLLDEFADSADSSAVKLQAAGLPRTANKVILPISSMKDTEIYAPTFRNGERVILVRHPHGGKFELPELTVNNRQREAKKLLGNAPDAVGINHRVAQHLSGADFDGDTVLVIPNPQGKIKTQSPLHELKNFDTKTEYPPYHGMRTMGGGTWNAHTGKEEYPPGKGPSGRTKGTQMGSVSNLITDMTIRGANDAELARAVRHSMVVIDAEKHSLNWRQSELDNGIAALKTKYQGGPTAGAKTLISAASSEVRINERKQGFKVDPKTGAKIHVQTGATYVNAEGKTVVKTQKSTRLAETPDAHTLSSGTPIEKIYADHSNGLKELANQARLASVRTKSTPISQSAKTTYAKEVASLNAKLNISLRNAPLERQAQVVGNAIVAEKVRANPDMDQAVLKKVRSMALEEARIRTGAKKIQVEITPSEWEAIQAGAVSNHKLTQILNHSNMDVVKKFATPKVPVLMTSAKQRRAASMLSSGFTQAEVADALGVSLTTLKDSLS